MTAGEPARGFGELARPLPGVRGAPAAGWAARLLADHAATPATLLFLLLAAVAGGGTVAFAEQDAVFISLSLIACVFVMLDFRIGVVLLIVLMPISGSSLFPHNIAGVTGLNPLNLLLFGTLASYVVRRPEAQPLPAGHFAPPPLLWLYVVPIVGAGLLGAGQVGAIPAYFQAAGLIGFDSAGGYLRDLLFKPLLMVLFALLVGAALARSKNPDRFLLPMIVSVWLMGVMTLLFVYLSGAGWRELGSLQARSFFSPLGMHANDLGRCYALAYALLLFTCAACRDWRLRLLLLASMAMVVLALLMTFSRGAFLGFAIVNILFLLTRRRLLPLLAGAAFLAGLLLLLPDAVFDRIALGWDSGANAVSAGRVDDIWRPLLPELSASPLFGNGLGSILWSMAMRTGSILEVTHPHNAYLQAALDMGLLGTVLLLAYFAHVLRGFFRLRRDPSLSPARRGLYEGAAAGLAGFLIVAFAGSSLTPVPEQSFLWLAIGMMYGERSRAAEKQHV